MASLLQSTVNQCTQCVFVNVRAYVVYVWKQDEYGGSKAGRLLWLVITQMKRRPVAAAVSQWW